MNDYSFNCIDKILKILNNSLPENYPMGYFKNIDIDRAVIVRESIFYRIKELAESGYEACLKDRLVSAIIIVRALMETEAFFIYFLNKLENAVDNKSFGDLKNFLTKSLLGTRCSSVNGRPSSTNVLTYIQDLDKKIPGFLNQYEFFCDFSHPNSAGCNRSYSKNDWENKEVIFGDNRDKIGIQFIQNQLGLSLEHFMDEYDRSAGVLNQWVILGDYKDN